MSAASTAVPPVQRSHSSRRTASYTPASTGQPHRSQSTSSRSQTASQSAHRTNSNSYSYNRTPSSQQPAPAPVANVLPHRDYETTNVARPQSSRRSTSEDRSYNSPPPAYDQAVRNGQRTSSSARPAAQPRYSSETPASPGRTAETPPSSSKGRRTTVTGSSGTWSLGKTIGAGSMGKVKLAKKLDGTEQVAVKIVPRYPTDDGRISSRDRERQEHSKEIRTAREAAIVSLLDHPYICAMRDVVRTNFHWYMLFEYVNGGQMLDYIISHGRLKEKQARKFGRQIASALDYCHRNSIVHRDLKIENILISKTGDIKIIDFGLSNLFSPRSHLKTFCGSLYFAAPELLQARQYTGPEVDIWSFGIVLYVLVCGKVPFDDQSMPKLHAKIKKGLVDYPTWLSAECKNLISRMLVTDPRQRATLHEIMNHPWITKGFNSAPENFLPPREPLQLPLDPNVVQGMTGFDFGAPEIIESQLTRVLESEEYQAAVRLAVKEQATNANNAERKRSFPGFDFYKRRNSSNSRDTLTNPSMEALHLGSDPVNAFSPLISIYYLVREKQERARLEANPGAMSIPKSPGELPLGVPDLPAPEAAHTNSTTYEMPGERATGGRSRPRARTHGEDEVEESMKKLKVSNQTPAIVTPPVEQNQPKRESAAVGILRRFSTRRHKEPEREKESRFGQPPPTVSVQAPQDQTSVLRKSFSIRRTRDRGALPPSNLQAGRSQPAHEDLLTPPGSADARSKGLGRSTSVNSADYRRRQRHGVSEGLRSHAVNEPPLTSGSDRSSVSGNVPRPGETPTDIEQDLTITPKSTSGRTKSLGHARRESIQARRARREQQREANVPEETDQELNAQSDAPESAENVKPVYLKGLFSVSTTSTKPVAAIRQDIIRVLKQLNVEYTEIRGGFSCTHSPSIDLEKVVDPNTPGAGTPVASDRNNTMSSPTAAHKRKISFGGFMGGNNGDRDEFRNHRDKTPRTPKQGPGTPGGNQNASFTNSDVSDDSVTRRERAMGETTTHVQSELSGSMILQFEIFIVKVPILSLHGIQFKRMAGGTWQYKNMAEKILKELRL